LIHFFEAERRRLAPPIPGAIPGAAKNCKKMLGGAGAPPREQAEDSQGRDSKIIRKRHRSS
jgi:hypothetical protein